METLHIKRGSGKDLCCAVFCMTVPLVGNAHTPHTHAGIWQHGMGRSPPLHKCSVVADSEQRSNKKTPTRLLNELLRPAGQTAKKNPQVLTIPQSITSPYRAT